jgi:hypothetical protein
MTSQKSFLAQPLKFFIALAAIIYLAVIFLNDGFMALDEYWVGITRYIPAQVSSLQNLVTSDDVKSPLQMLPMYGVAQAALKWGVTSPYWQYRIVIAVLAVFNFVLIIFAFLKFAEALQLSHKQRNFLILLLTFYFGASFALTRPMYESISAPWLTLAAVWAVRYDLDAKIQDLMWGVVFVSMAFILRQQLGLCALIFILLAVLKKNFKHFLLASALGLVIFILAGIPDYYLRGKFHFSLLNLTAYNYQHGSDYGRKPITFYPFMILAMTFFPFFIAKYPKDLLQKSFKQQRSVWVILFLFVFLHSLFPQKWERFLISVIPLLLFLFFPFLDFLQSHFKKYKFRLISLYTLNGVLFGVASFFPPQKNLIEMSLYLDQHPKIKLIHRLNDTPGWITEAFILDKQFEFIESDLQKVQAENWTDCSKALVVAEHDLKAYESVTQKLFLKAEFNVNLIEQFAYKLNPKNNARRVKLNLFTGCQSN